MSITIHQRPHLFLWHWRTGPAWVRSRSDELIQLYADGARVIRVQLQDDGEIPVAQAKVWRDVGMKVWGMVGHVGDWGHDPEGLAAWLRAERVRLSLTGLDLNFEDEVNGFDARSGGDWSARFAREARRLMPTLPMHLDSYWGPMGDKINLGAYKAAGFRFSVQTFWGQPPIKWADPPTNIVRKGLGAQPVIPKSILKPIFLVSPGAGGEVVHIDTAIADAKRAGTIGCGFYYIDGAEFGYLSDFVRKSVAAGIAR